MPRYFFHFYDRNSKNLVRDSEGFIFADFRKAKSEAIGLAQNLADVGIDRSTWQVLVADENGFQVFSVALSKVQTRKFRRWIDLAHRIATYEPKFRPQIFTCLLMVAVFAMIGQAIVLTPRVREISHGTYHLASAETRTWVNVRFVPGTSITDIEKFLEAYKASLIGGPSPGGWYRLQISESMRSLQELRELAGKMTQENIVSLVAVTEGEQ